MKGLGDRNGPASMRNHSATTSATRDSLHRLEVITGVPAAAAWSLEEKARIVARA